MRVVDHGEWEIYEPEVVPDFLRNQKVMFSRRASDGRDWYEFRKELTNPVSIKMTVMRDTVMATTLDASEGLFPAGERLLEVFDAGHDHESFRQKRYDNGRFVDPDPMSVHRSVFLIALHRAGLLQRWRDYVDGLDDVPLQIWLREFPMIHWNDRRMRRAFGHLGFSDGTLRQVFDAAKKETSDG